MQVINFILTFALVNKKQLTLINLLVMENEYEFTYEFCPYCEQDVKLQPELSIQICPSCGKHIVSCSMCETMHCSICPLSREVDKFNN